MVVVVVVVLVFINSDLDETSGLLNIHLYV